MKVLFIFDDGAKSSFFLYDLIGGRNRLWRIAPEIAINQVALGDLYLDTPIEKFLQYFSIAFDTPVDKYLIVTKAEGLEAIKEAGLNEQGLLAVTIEKDFTALSSGESFHQGEHLLNLQQVDAYLTYQIDADGSFDVFKRQEDLIRLMKWKTVKPSLSTITKNFGTVKEHTNSNLGLRDMLKLGSGYLAKGNAQMEKINVPAADSYRLEGTFPYQLGAIDWSKNQLQLREDLR